MTAYYLKTLYIFAFKILTDLKKDQIFDHLLSLSDKKQMIKRKKKQPQPSHYKTWAINLVSIDTGQNSDAKKEGKKTPASLC